MKFFTQKITSSVPIKTIIFLFGLVSLVSCGNNDDNPQNGFNTLPYVNPIGGGPIGGIPGGFGGGPMVNDQFSPQIFQALNSVACSQGRISKSFISGPNGSGNVIYGPFSEGIGFLGQPLAVYIGGNRQNGDVMIIRKLGNGLQVTGYQMELHLCIDNILVTPQRPLTGLQIRGGHGIVLDTDARCSAGDIDYGPVQLTALPGGLYSNASPVLIGVAPLGVNFCGF